MILIRLDLASKKIHILVYVIITSFMRSFSIV